MASVTYNLRITGDTDTINNPYFIIRAVRIVNQSGDGIVFNNGVDGDLTVPAGTSPVFNQEHLISTFTTRSLSRTIGSAVAVVYDSPQDMSTNPPLTALPGVNSVSQAAGTTFNINPAAGAVFNVQPGAGAQFTITPALNANFTVTPALNATFTVNPTGSAVFTINPAAGALFVVQGTVTISSGSVTINNTQPITFINPDLIATYQTLNNQTASITLTRQTEQLTVQPVMNTLTRGGELSVTAVDSTTQTYEFLENEPFSIANAPNGSFGPSAGPVAPFVFNRFLKSGTVVSVKFTGACGFIVGY